MLPLATVQPDTQRSDQVAVKCLIGTLEKNVRYALLGSFLLKWVLWQSSRKTSSFGQHLTVMVDPIAPE